MPVTPSDLFLSPDLTEEQAQRYLESLGFRDAAAADHHLRVMADDPAVRQALGALADSLIEALKRAADPDAAVVGLSRYLGARSAKVTFLQYLRDDSPALAVLVELFGTSPFLAEILIRNPEYFHWLTTEIDRSAPTAVENDHEFDAWLANSDGVARIDALKRLKRRHLLRIAARDILGRDTLQAATAQLSALADVVVSRTLDVVVRERLASETLERLPGTFAVIGMGKLGGGELNYSSDVDLMYLYEPDDEDDARAHACFQRLARKLTAALAEHTAEGYCYRVDLRLRPMGRSGNIAYSLRQLRQYYETWGETFERFAMIKARPVAGDRGLGRRFVEGIRPFVYRKYLDHAAIEEMYQYKVRMDRASQSLGGDRNVKLGRGGIREVELFTQVLQLTYGAARGELQQRNTLAGLEALRRAQLISDAIHDGLAEAYTFLRTVEHRLQIVQESHTHTLSSNPDDLAICARRLRFENAEKLEAALEAYRARVHDVYRELFERRAGTSSFESRQFFRILGDDVPRDEALAHLSRIGLSDPAAVLDAMGSLGQQASTASAPTAARNVLANLLAVCTPRLVRSGRPERVLIRFDQLAAQTGGVALLCRSLLENDVLRDALIDVLDSGELLAQRVIRYPELLDALVQPRSTVAALRRSFESGLARMEALEYPERMLALRRFKHSHEFKILVRWLATGSLDQLQEELSLLADYCTAGVARWRAPVRLDDPIAAWAIIALGKLGGAELTVHSDLDLVFVYEDERDPGDSTLRWQTFVGETQTFLGDPTSEGVAYRIDTRLRPEGTKGPLAIPFAALVEYFGERAEPWERLAWTRAQILVGSPALSTRLLTATNSFVYGRWDPGLPQSMHAIRMRMERELGKEGPGRLDFKVGHGGLADIDFLLELVQIREGRTRPEFRVPGTRRLLTALPPTLYISLAESEWLREALRILRTIETLARLDADSNISWLTPDAATLNPLGTRMGFGDAPGERLLALYRDVTARVRSTYATVLARLDDHR